MGLFGWPVNQACMQVASILSNVLPARRGWIGVPQLLPTGDQTQHLQAYFFFQLVSYTLRTKQTGINKMLPAWDPESLEVSTVTEI